MLPALGSGAARGNNAGMSTGPRPLRQRHAPRYSGRWWRRYQRETRRPLQCLLFLLPLVLVYELGVFRTTSGNGTRWELLAPASIREVFGWLGLAGVWVPGLVLIGTLLVWHRLARDRWRVRLWVLPGMLVESLLLAVPLLVLTALFPQSPEAVSAHLSARLVRALGAGIYEELVFRLLVISGLVWLAVEIAHTPHRAAVWVAVGLSAALFSRCHFEPMGGEPFTWNAFWFRLVAGVYLAVVFVGRGLGVSGGCHAVYNVLLVWLRGVGG